MTIIIIAFPAAPQIDPEAQKKAEELNKHLLQTRAELSDSSKILKRL